MTVSADQGRAAGCFVFLPLRLLVVTMTIMCTSFCYIGRQNISLAIIGMTQTKKNGSEIPFDNETTTEATETMATIAGIALNQLLGTNNTTNFTSTTTTPSLLNIPTTTNQPNFSTIDPLITPLLTAEPNQQNYGPRYNWEGSRVLGAFFWTYVLCQIPGGRMGEIIGPKWILFTAGLGTAILSGLSPLAASFEATGDWSFFFIRLLMGVCQAALFPACYTILTNWLPIRERQLALPVMNLSAYFGSILAMIETSYFMTSPQFGWPYAFYLPALLCLMWSCVWIFLGTSKPEEHSCITKRELEYIETHKGDVKSTTNALDWCKLFKSTQVWAVIVAFFGSNWSFNLMLQMLPSYLSYYQGIDPSQNANINIYMYIIYCVSAPLIGTASSYLITKRTCGLSSRAVRVIFQSISVWGQAICFIILVQLGNQKSLVLATLYIQMLSYSFVNGGEVHLPTEISAEFGGTIYAIANSFGSACGFIIPSVLDFIVSDKTNVDQWNTFLYVAAGVSFVGNLVFVFLAGNEPEDLSKSCCFESDSLSQGTFKLIENGHNHHQANGHLANGSVTSLAQVELNEMDKLRKTTTKDYSSITMNGNLSDTTNANGRKLS